LNNFDRMIEYSSRPQMIAARRKRYVTQEINMLSTKVSTGYRVVFFLKEKMSIFFNK